MSNFYSDGKFGVINRKWFGLTKKWGGDCANGYTFATTDATVITQLAKWYPRGPIKMLKAGTFILGTVTNASVDRIPVRLRTRGASASLGCLFYNAKGNQAVIASTTTFTVSKVKAGEYINIVTGTPQTDKGTAANTATTTGTVAFFVDYVPTYDPTGKWDAT
jgi:hypothetical protein